MFTPDDTIVAVATPPGRGGLGIVRVSGPDARDVAEALIGGHGAPLEPRRATLVTIRPHASMPPIDHAIVTWFPAPHSYTGDEVVEISAHGSPVVLRQILRGAMGAGARLAEPGEFTLRAFLNGRIDLVQAEAIADLVDAVTPLQARAAFDQLQGTLTGAIAAMDRELLDLVARLEASIDFPEEGFHFIEMSAVRDALARLVTKLDALLGDAERGRLIRDGLQVAIVGKPNVGKSTLFNHLVGTARTIVSRHPGTTRDLVVEQAELEGLRLTLVDTAGLRETVDEIEAEGVSRARRSMDVAELILAVFDRSRPLDRDDRSVLAATSGRPRLLVVNKADLRPAWNERELECEAPRVTISLETLDGVNDLGPAIRRTLDAREWSDDTPAVTNVRHVDLLRRAREALAGGCEALDAGAAVSEELVLAEIADARSALEEISGRRTSEDVLRHIFERFCIGK
jgi:tRNA modification GTPase